MIKPDRVTDKAIRFVTADEFAALLAACDAEVNKIWWRTFLLVAYTAGLRFSELLNLVWSDCDFEGGVVHVTPKTDTKKRASSSRSIWAGTTRTSAPPARQIRRSAAFRWRWISQGTTVISLPTSELPLRAAACSERGS